MVKSIFVDPLNFDGLKQSGANHLIVTLDNLTQKIWRELKRLDMMLSISFASFDRGNCPANPEALEKLLNRIDQSLVYQPAEIWLDHFRFDGYWEGIKNDQIPELHKPCHFCKDKNRVKVLKEILVKIKEYVGQKTKLCYFAVPFKTNVVTQLTKDLGQDHTTLGKIFDASSPMFYHRMIKKPTAYISDFVSWMAKQTKRPILPIIQIKDMPASPAGGQGGPDNLEDKLTEKEITKAFNEARKVPSSGVCFFYWTHALEKNKTGIISKLFSSS